MWALLLVLAPSASGQIDTGVITGRVSDSSGAVVANAAVSIVQADMNFETSAKTNADGEYRVQSLRPGPYRVTISAPGFKRAVRDGLSLRVGDALELNVSLEVGGVNESVQVTGAAPLLETETSAAGATMQGDYVYDLPNYKREVSKSLFYTPGVTFVNGPGSDAGLGGQHIAGMATGVTGYFEDGQLNSIGSSGTVMNGVEEIRVLDTTLPAEFGHSAGGAVTVVKKSGTNEVHGIASMYGRTRMMQQRKFFDEYRNSQIQPGWTYAPGLLFYEPDFNLNGPVYIPHVYNGKNKTFFMYGYQWQVEKQPKQQASTVPSLAEYNGDFTFGGIGQAVYDPRSRTLLANGNWTSTPFPGNIVPQSAWSNVAKNILALHPYALPNVAGSITSSGPANNLYSAPEKLYREDEMTLRLDHQFTSNVKAYGSWTEETSKQRQPPWTIAEDSLFDGTAQVAVPRSQVGSMGLSWILSPTLVTDMRTGFYRSYTNTPSIAYEQNYAAKLGIPNLPPDTMPQNIGPSGFTESLNVGGPSVSANQTMTFKDDTTKTRGQHAFKFGYELLRTESNSHSPGNPSGSFTYTSTSGLQSNGSAIANTGNNFATFLVGAVSSASYSENLLSNLPRNWEHSFYFQDDWKVSPVLTLNMGLRYELETPPNQKWGQISVFNPTIPDTSQYTNYTCPAGGCFGGWTHPAGAQPYPMQHNRLDPRFGLAWHPMTKLVFRAGFAVSHLDLGTQLLYTDELTSVATTQSQAVGNQAPLFMIDQGPPKIVYPSLRADGSVPFSGNPGGHTGNIINQNLHAPYGMNWNAGVQYQVHKDYLVEVRYVGSAEVGILGSYDTNALPWGIIPNPNGAGTLNLNDPANAAYRNTWLNTDQYSRPFPAWGNINLQGNNGHMTHHDGTVRIEKRYSKGLNFLAFYTIGKTLSGNSSGDAYLNWHLNKGRPGYDQLQDFTGTMTYEIPIGKGRKWLNHRGVVDNVIGGFNLVWTYTITSGNPAGISIAGNTALEYPSFMPTYGNVMLLQNPRLRNDWQDLGGDRFNQNNQNSMINCGTFVVNWGDSCMAADPAFTNGTNGVNVWNTQRAIAASVSASKEVIIHERLRFQFRWDFQNPFKWYNWAPPTTSLNISSLSNSKSFGTTSVGGEAVSTNYGGLPAMNITLAFKW